MITIAPFPYAQKKNPYCSLLHRALREQGVTVVEDASLSLPWLKERRDSVQILHLHWLSPFYHHHRGGLFSLWRALRFSSLLSTAHALGYKIVWTMHNYKPHDGRSHMAGMWVRRRLLQLADAITVHCELAKNELSERGTAPERIHVVPHGNYCGYYPNEVNRDTARSRLGLPKDAKVFLSFGLIRRYKNIERIVEDFSRINDPACILLVAGRPIGEYCRTMLERLRMRYASDRIRIHDRYVADDELQLYFNSADFSVFAFREILTSGSVVLSLSFACPVIAPHMGCLRELKGSKAVILYDPDDPSGLIRAVRKAMRLNGTQLRETSLRLAKSWSWEEIARRYTLIYNQIIHAAPE